MAAAVSRALVLADQGVQRQDLEAEQVGVRLQLRRQLSHDFLARGHRAGRKSEARVDDAPEIVVLAVAAIFASGRSFPTLSPAG